MIAGRPGRIVIVGAGHAGFRVAVELRLEGYDGSIVLLDAQRHLPYQRPPLSKAYLNGDLDADAVAFRPAGFFEKENIWRCPGEAATVIDRAAMVVRTAAGREFGYDALVLATGAVARPAPFAGASLAGVHELRTRGDADRIAEAMRRSQQSRSQQSRSQQIVVIGGGFIGLEVASAARKRGLDVVVLESQSRLMSRALGETLSDYCLRAHRAVGITVKLRAMVSELRGQDGRVRAVELASGERLPADVVVIGLGVRPCTTLAEDAGLEIDDGIAVNEYLETSDPAISAIGDCCSFPYAATGERVRLESVQNATDHARCVARRLLGKREPYTDSPWFWSDQGEVRLQMVGLGAMADREVVHGNPASGRFSVLRFLGDRLVCGESVNSARDHVSLRTLVAHGADPEVVEFFREGVETAELRTTAELRAMARSLRRPSSVA